MDDESHRVALTQVLQRAQAPIARVMAAEAAQQCRQKEQERNRLAAVQAKREQLLADAGYARGLIAEHRAKLDDYLASLSQSGRDAVALMLASRGHLELAEEQALELLAEDLQDTLATGNPPPAQPSETVHTAIEHLLADYRKQHLQIVQATAECFGSGPTLDRARSRLAQGRPLAAEELNNLESDARRDRDAARAERKRQRAYLAKRDLIAEERLHRSGALSRFKHQPAEFHEQIDAELLRRCTSCRRVVYPPPVSEEPACLFCDDDHLQPYSPDHQPREPA